MALHRPSLSKTIQIVEKDKGDTAGGVGTNLFSYEALHTDAQV